MPLADKGIIQNVDQLKDVLQSLVLYAAVLFAAISAMCFIIGTTRLSKMIVSGGKMMQPSILLSCFILVAYFAGHADAFGYAEGLCFNIANGRSGGCTSNDVSATVTNYTGPRTCTVGSSIIGSITTKIDVTSNTRYDIGVYIGLNGANARVDNRTNACLVQTLREIDANNSLNGGRIGHLEGVQNNDECLDSGQGEIFGFQIDNFKIECIESTNGTVTISACFAWDNSKQKNCPGPCAGAPNNTLHEKCLLADFPVSVDNPNFSD